VTLGAILVRAIFDYQMFKICKYDRGSVLILGTLVVLQAAFSQVAGSLGAPQLGQGSSSAGAGPSAALAPSAVVDLGVVGRGTKRVTPMPLPPGAAGQPILHLYS